MGIAIAESERLIILYMNAPITDSDTGHWVNRAPRALRPYLQLSRLDRPIGYWLLSLPGWIGLAFASLTHGFAPIDIAWAAFIFIGAVAMRGAGCTYNDIVDQDLDAQVTRTALRPLPAGTVTTMQAWGWLFIQCFVGLLILLCLPRLAQIISLCSLPLVAAYPFMKRITWWPQVWLGLTFNWAVFVAYAAKTETVSAPLLILYGGLIFWTIGYDTIYACQDREDDAMIGVKSTARLAGESLPRFIKWAYGCCVILIIVAIIFELRPYHTGFIGLIAAIITPLGFSAHLAAQLRKLKQRETPEYLGLFKSNKTAAILLILGLISGALILHYLTAS